ncbi:MAG: F0F1 ATP synthase subunit A, partial [Verrucomicrobiota bacterium]
EVISISVRPVSLSLRLYGNVFAGENIIWSVAELGTTLGDTFGFSAPYNYIVSFFASIPFYCLELLIGLIQAFVFVLLCAVYIRLSTTHDDH